MNHVSESQPRRLKLLIVDDHAPFRRLLRSLFPPSHHEVWECDEGADAVWICEKYQPDWVLMDLEMKPLDGLTATREIVIRHPEAKVLLLTQYDDPELRVAARLVGAQDCVMKERLSEIIHLMSGEFEPVCVSGQKSRISGNE